METTMKRRVGVWIDHRKAVIVTLTDAGEEIHQITSGMEKHVRFSSGSSEDGSTEDIRDRQFSGHLTTYYEDVVAHIRDAEAILLLGPGEAKGELEKLLKTKGLGGCIAGTETADKLTDRQIAAKVRQHFFEQKV
jgi:stalled ribosome rescue protein Dom34